MSDLVAIAYDDLSTAQDVLGNLSQAVKEHVIELDDAVIVERQQDGKVKLHQPSTAAAGAVGGALWGGLIGLIFLMPLLGMALGAAGGAAGGALADAGIDDNFMKQLGNELPPGGAAVFLLVRRVSTDKVLPQIKNPGRVIRTSLSDQSEAELQAALDRAGQAA
ncbi:MAG: DUF1269 domain-containing protein [Solirubrobacterales bacterium]|nr:DUF1269 domain-containing protein [Solirubrobacterales bacterium]